jgi:hypothetical protein
MDIDIVLGANMNLRVLNEIHMTNEISTFLSKIIEENHI